MSSKRVKPIGNKVLLKLAPVENMSKGGIITTTAKREQSGVIVELGTNVDESAGLELGQKVLFGLGEFKIVEKQSDGTELAVVPVEQVIGFFYED